jgi:uncharacterized RDD family membrane protein YckC
MEVQETNEDLLILEPYYNRATWRKRLTNYLIDIFIFTFLFMGVGILLTTITPTADEFVEGDSFGLITSLIYAIYMSLQEAIFKGKTFAKFITKTRAVNSDGSDISTGSAFGRGFSRIVPFCAFSALGNPCNPWQDRWTKTIVIDEQNPTLS